MKHIFSFITLLLISQTILGQEQVGTNTNTTTTDQETVEGTPAGPIEPQDPIGDPCLTYPYYLDRDGDGLGDKNDSPRSIFDCNTEIIWRDPVTGEVITVTLVSNNNDCNDRDANIGDTPLRWYPDQDKDGLGDKNHSGILSCEAQVNHVLNNKDCNDNNDQIKGPFVYYRDQDGDGYGDSKNKKEVCSGGAPSGYVLDNRDIDDNNVSVTIYPLPPGPDDPGCIGEGDQAFTTVYRDVDGDGIGTGLGYETCKITEGYTTTYGDCDDDDPNIGIVTWYRDQDEDGFGDPNTTMTSRDVAGSVISNDCSPPIGYVDNSLDHCPYEKGSSNGCIIDENPNDNFNSIKQYSFDIQGNLIGGSKAYYDDLGKPMQIQTVDFKTEKVWNSEVRYDDQGRAALQTLSSPIRENERLFEYKQDFIKTSGGSLLSESNPATIANDEYTLGWYYSTQNNDEPYQDVTSRPYSRTIYSELNPETALRSIGGNQQNGQWRQGYSFTMRAGNELADDKAFHDPNYNYEDYTILKTVVRDIHGVESVVFTDSDGRTLAAARSGNEEGSIENNREARVKIGAQGYVDVHIPVGRSGIKLAGNGDYTTVIHNLITEEVVSTGVSNLPAGFYRISVNDPDNYTADAITVTYPENYYDYSLNYYDEAGRLLSSKQPLNKLESTFEYNSLGQLIHTSSPDEGEAWFKYRKDGQIRFSQNTIQRNNNKMSFTHYDDKGRPIRSGVYTGRKPINFDTLDPDGFIAAGIESQVQRTIYDFLSDDSVLPDNYKNPTFLVGNVAKTENEQTITHYSYDIYGRVKWIVQNIKDLGFKTIDYTYDPITSQVTHVTYQKGKSDQFIHKYTYDPVDYSLIKVETSTNGKNYTTHAEYDYYETGALKRTELAGGLQGIDYVYNLNGALKSINHPGLTSNTDPGGDNNDLFGMNLHYYQNDYARTGTPKTVTTTSNGIEQYNGNIKAIEYNTKRDGQINDKHSYYYTYNKNNWLTGASYNTPVQDISDDINPTETRNKTVTRTDNVQARESVTLKKGFHIKATSALTFSAKIATEGRVKNNGDYNVYDITYDANGNIQKLNRNKDKQGGSNAMDKLSYVYKTDKPNQLLRVDDAAGDAGVKDIGDQDGNNYVYNEIGQLIRNESEDINYLYTATGLVSQVNRGGNPLVKFFYNDKNHRVRKESYSNGSLQYTEFYVRDAAGTAMAIYRKNGQKGQISLEENTIYGASRLGVRKATNNSYVYQLTDHLGNVRAVIAKQGNNAMAVTAATDYYPFGMPMPNRNDQSDYRYAYQGQEKDPETGKEAFELRLWDSRIGRWLTTDPAGQYHSPYKAMGNNPIVRVDPDGGYDGVYNYNVETGETTKVSNEGDDIGQHTINYVNGSGRRLGSRTLRGFSPGEMSFGSIVNTNDKVYNALYWDVKRLALKYDFNESQSLAGVYNGAIYDGMSNAADGTMKMLITTAAAPYLLSGSLSFSLQGAGSRMLIDGGTELIANGGDITKVNLLSVGASAFASNLGAELISSKYSLSLANGFESSSLTQTAINFAVGRVNGGIHDSYLKFTGKFPFNSGFSKAFLGSLSVGVQSGTKFFTSN